MRNLFSLLLLLVAPSAWAADATLAVTAGSGTNVGGITNGASTFYSGVVVTDPTTTTQHQAVDGSGNASVKVGAALPAGTNLIGKVGIDQTTPGTTNGIVCNSGCGSVSPITPATSNAGSSLVLKASAGTLYSASAVNYSTTAGFMIAYNATAAPSPGALTAALVLACMPLPPSAYANISYSGLPGATFSTGITILLSSAASCVTYTTGSITGYIAGQAS